MPSNHTRIPSFSPSFLTSGVPEYPVSVILRLLCR
jgi:hypothetical protein